jgi:flagellar assembly protein FliH
MEALVDLISKVPLSSTGKTLVPVQRAVRPNHLPHSGNVTPLSGDQGSIDLAVDPLDPATRQLQEAIRRGYEEGFSEGQREGLEQGFESGHQQGYEAGKKQAELDVQDAQGEIVRRLVTLSQGLQDARIAVLHGAHDDVVCAVYESLCKLVGHHLVTRSGVLAHVETVLGRVAERRGIRIRLHPEDLALIQRLSGIDSLGGPIEWVPDSTIGYGGSIVESAAGEFRARLDDQMKTLLLALSKARDVAEIDPSSIDTAVHTDPDPVMQLDELPVSVDSGATVVDTAEAEVNVGIASQENPPKPFAMKWGAV